jgi:hypothetical protein
MRKQLLYTIDLLKQRVMNNLKTIKENERVIRKLMGSTKSPFDEESLANTLARNKELLAENNEALRIQFGIIEFMNKHLQTKEKGKIIVYENEEELFDLTTTGTLPFDEEHPRFTSEEFYKKLMEYYISNEDYEKCNKLKEVKETKKEQYT